MFGKLLKYDFRAMFKQFAFIWPSALVLALVNHFTANALMGINTDVVEVPGGGASTTAAGITMMVYVAILIAMFVVAVIFTIQRFYKGLLGDEGYLMHTLPVRPWQLIGSKLLCAVFATFISVAVALLSILIIVPWDREGLAEFFQALRYLFTHWDLQATHGAIGLLEIILVMLASFATGYLQLYLSMSIGHLFNKNRVAWSVAACIAVSTVVNALAGAVLRPAGRGLEQLFKGFNTAGSFHLAMWLVIAGELVLCAAYFAGTEHILRRRLNLE